MNKSFIEFHIEVNKLVTRLLRLVNKVDSRLIVLVKIQVVAVFSASQVQLSRFKNVSRTQDVAVLIAFQVQLSRLKNVSQTQEIAVYIAFQVQVSKSTNVSQTHVMAFTIGSYKAL